jgi:molybdate transport system substrate-binding protein
MWHPNAFVDRDIGCKRRARMTPQINARRSHMAMRLLAISVLVAAIAGPAVAADISVFSSGAPAEVEKAVAATFARDTGHRVVFTVATPAEIQAKLRSGETPDIVVLPAPIIETLEKAGALRPGRVDLARVGIGVIVREGAPRSDISTVDAVRKMLLDARSIVHPDPAGGGLAGVALARMMAQMGIADAVKPKLTYMFAINGGATLVAKGEVEVGLFNISEVLSAKGITLLGPLPSAVQSYIVFSASIHAGSHSSEPAQAFIRALSAPTAREHWKAGGLESMGGGG